MKWWEGDLVCFDTESSGVDWETDRIVTFCVARLDSAGKVIDSWEALLNPGVEIPAEATAVHGVTNEMAADGHDPKEKPQELVEYISSFIELGLPVIAFNGRFDVTLLDREMRRHLGFLGLETVFPDELYVIDPYVCDKATDRYRRGSRKLGDTCKLYGVELDDWHNATADAVAAGRLAQAMVKKHRGLQIPLPKLHRAQEIWASQQAASLELYLRKKNNDDSIVCERSWPIVPFQEALA